MAEKVYLYNKGDQCTDVTGGWDSFTHEEYGIGKTKVTFNAENVLLEAWGMGNAHRSEGGGTGFISSYTGTARMHTVNLIDLTYVSSITAVGTVSTSEDKTGHFKVRLVTNTIYTNIIAAEAYGEGTVTLDTSGLTGEYYVCVDSTENGSYEKLEDLTYENYEEYSKATITEVSMVIDNHPPTAPGSLTVSPTECMAGDSLTLSAGEATDEDGDTLSYVFEASFNKGEWKQISTTEERTITYKAPSGATTIDFRVSATDGKSNSEPAYSDTVAVTNNTIYGRVLKIGSMN